MRSSASAGMEVRLGSASAVSVPMVRSPRHVKPMPGASLGGGLATDGRTDGVGSRHSRSFPIPKPEAFEIFYYLTTV